MSILDEIFAHKRAEVAERQVTQPLALVRGEAESAAPPLDFIAALRGSRVRPALIAEIKRASPSRGLLLANFDPSRLARIYRENGAAAISVLTDERYFQGHLDHLRSLAEARPRLPLLRKDFLCEPYQVYEARTAGADAVLLIVASLSPALLGELHDLARGLGMAALVEAHTAAELATALDCGASLIGINNRNLHDFTVDLATTEALCGAIPPEICVVAESGIHTAADVDRLAAIPRPRGTQGVDAILVGEALVTAPDVAAQVRSLTRRPPCHVPGTCEVPGTSELRIKICGITTLADGLAAVEAGADMLGFNFYPKSSRDIEQRACARLVAALRDRGLRFTAVGVFVNTPPQAVAAILDGCGLDLAQLHGDEPPADLAFLGARAFKAVRPADADAAREAMRRYGRQVAPGLLIDAAAGGAYGGAGQLGNWDLAREVARDCPILLAGGLRPENVAAAVTQVRPWGVDVASGVESSPGCKDHAKMIAFVKAARGVNNGYNNEWGKQRIFCCGRSATEPPFSPVVAPPAA